MSEALIHNKRINADYEILEKFEAGIKLLGFEVKSLKSNQGSLVGSFVTVRGGEAFLIGLNIPPYQEKNVSTDYDPKRNRKLLLNKAEIERITLLESTKGLTVVPTMMYNKGKKIKIEIAIVRGKKKFDKREDIKKREIDRDIRRTLKN
jgi:SsrA-binding protein